MEPLLRSAPVIGEAFWAEMFDPSANPDIQDFALPEFSTIDAEVREKTRAGYRAWTYSSFLTETSIGPRMIELIGRARQVYKQTGSAQAVQEISAIGMSYFMPAVWHGFNRPTYVLDPETARLLSLTDLPEDATPNEVRLPHQAFFLHVPEDLVDLGDLPKQAGILVVQERGEDSELEDALYFLIAEPGRPPLYTYFFRSTDVRNWTFQQNIEHTQGLFQHRRNHDAYGNLYRLIYGFALYLTYANPTVVPIPAVPRAEITTKNAAKRRKQLQRENRKRHVSYLYIGRNRITEKVPATESQMIPAHWVRGHWRKQLWGPKRAYVKRRWIEPYLRGQEVTPETETQVFNVVPGEARKRA